MSCMADVHEVQEANDKSKFHRQIKTFCQTVAKCGVRPWNSTRSVGGRAKSTSWTFRNQVYVVSQVRRCLAGQRRVNETWQLEVEKSLDRKPVQLTKNWRDVVPSSSSGEKPSGGILDGLNFADEALRQPYNSRWSRSTQLLYIQPGYYLDG